MMKTLTFEQLPQGGFAGLIERRFVINQALFGRSKTIAFAGLGNFVYLADANFLPHGETHMHGHKEVDVISVMVAGDIIHQGSLGHGQRLTAGSVQVQRAGAEGFHHNEVNPNAQQNHMIQLWVLPDQPGEAAGYKHYQPKQGEHIKIYGGSKTQQATFNSAISVSVSNTVVQQSINITGEAMVYLSLGEAKINGEVIQARTLVHDKHGLTLTALTEGQAIFIYKSDQKNEALS
ncbi:pirin family protein [Colwellia sp. M166]|jgi:redox-sensitive bicupin YhaK (pirin superfamily)|uniref:pirin family protein n=1 Tax=Colwellia sp. M166 TaxID=2583805 RepID=UPI00211EAFB3|nr:pirin family protein [Colwellia sp. M166]|tara:strand:+ start:4687 stop:5388 length:702 start_codon:yes stop_codon:yes gene_type:complete